MEAMEIATISEVLAYLMAAGLGSIYMGPIHMVRQIRFHLVRRPGVREKSKRLATYYSENTGPLWSTEAASLTRSEF